MAGTIWSLHIPLGTGEKLETVRYNVVTDAPDDLPKLVWRPFTIGSFHSLVTDADGGNLFLLIVAKYSDARGNKYSTSNTWVMNAPKGLFMRVTDDACHEMV